MEERSDRVSFTEGQFVPNSQSRTSVETSKTYGIQLSTTPVIIDHGISDSMANTEKQAQGAHSPVTPSPSRKTSRNNSGEPESIAIYGEEKAIFSAGDTYANRRAGDERNERVPLIEEHFVPRSQSRSFVETSKTGSIRLSDAPVIPDRDVSDGMVTDKNEAQNADSSVARSPSEETSANNPDGEEFIAIHGKERANFSEVNVSEDRQADMEEKGERVSLIEEHFLPRTPRQTSIEKSKTATARIRLSDASLVTGEELTAGMSPHDKDAHYAHTPVTNSPYKDTFTNNSWIAGDIVIQAKEKATSSEGDTYEDKRTDRDEKLGRISLTERPPMPTSQGRPSLEKSKTARITLSDVPVVIGEELGDGMVAEEKKIQHADNPITHSHPNETSTKRTETERLRFRSTLATFINDDKGLYGEWQAKVCAATAAAKDLLQVLAERVENLLNEATAVTGRLFCRRSTFREEELQRWASSRKRSSSFVPLRHMENISAGKADEREVQIEHRAEVFSYQGGGTEAQPLPDADFIGNQTQLVNRVAAELLYNLLKVAMQSRSETLKDRKEERREEGSIEYREASKGDIPVSEKEPVGSLDKQTSAEKDRSSLYELRSGNANQFSRSSLESYDAANFPEDLLICPRQENHSLTRKAAETRGEFVSEPKARESLQTKHDRLWKIFGRETQAGRLLYQLYKPPGPGRDLVYPIPKSMKDLRGNLNCHVMTHESSSSMAAAAARHQKRRQVKVAVPRVGRHPPRAAAAAGGSTRSGKFEKGNFLNGRGPGGKRSTRQIAKETERRRQQILEEASSQGVAAAAMGLKRDKEKALMLQKLPYTICSVLPEAARLPPLSARDRAVFFAERAALDRASLYSAASASPSPRARKSSGSLDRSGSSSTRRGCHSTTNGCSLTSLEGTKHPNYCSTNQISKSFGRGILDPCTQTLVPYVAAARQRYKKQGLIDAETGMTEEQKHLFIQILKEIQLRKDKLENLQKALPDHVLAASLLPVEEQLCANEKPGKKDIKGNTCDTPGGRPGSSDRKTSRPQSGVDSMRKEANLLSSCFSPDMAKSRLAQRAILQQLQDETKLKREIKERMKELEILLSISDAQQEELKRNRRTDIVQFNG